MALTTALFCVSFFFNVTQKDKKKEDKKKDDKKKDKKEKEGEKDKGGNYIEEALLGKKEDDFDDDADGQDSVDTEVGVDDAGAMGKFSGYL